MEQDGREAQEDPGLPLLSQAEGEKDETSTQRAPILC